MDVPWTRTSSAFLLLTFNIGFILCQNVGQECPLSGPPHGDVYNEYNPGIINPQPPKNKVRFYPANRTPTGPIRAITEYQKPPYQENVNPTLNPRALSSPESYPNLGPANKQSRSDQFYLTESCNGERLPCPYSETLLNPNPCPEPPITPVTIQNQAQFEAYPQKPFQLRPFCHGISSGPFSLLSFANPDISDQTPVNDVEDVPGQSFSSNNAFTSLSVPMLRKFFTPLVPYRNSRLPQPCADIQPSPFPQGPSIPVEPLNDQGCLSGQVDVHPLQNLLPQPCANTPPTPFPQGPSIPVEPLNNQGCLANQVDVLPLQHHLPCPNTLTPTFTQGPSISVEPLSNQGCLSGQVDFRPVEYLLPLPCVDIQSSPFNQGPSVPVEQLSNQGFLASPVDCIPLQQCTREKDNPITNFPSLNLESDQIPPNHMVNCLPESPITNPFNTLPQSPPCAPIPPYLSSIDPFHDTSSLSSCDQCKVTRSLCSYPVSSCQSCQPANHCSVCDDEPSLFQIETCLQVPHNIQSCVCNENCPPQPYSDFHPSSSLSSGCCSCTNNGFLPLPCCTPQSCCVTQTCGTPNNCFDPSQPQLSCDCQPPCSSCVLPLSSPVCVPCCESPCHSPEPINVQINVPPPIIPAPSITIINPAPEPAPTSIDSGYFDMSPMIIDNRRRRSKSWLPLLLVWLFSCDGFGGF